MRQLSLLLALSAAACLRQTEYKCTSSAQCLPDGTCQAATGFCSFPDSACSGGGRYAASAGSYAGECVGGSTGSDGGIDSPLIVDGPPGDSAGSNNCPGFSTLGTLPHRYKRVTAAAWNSQMTTCSGLVTGAYIAIPDDATELAELDTLAGGGTTLYWVGITDGAHTGNYTTVKGAAATYLPWDTANGQPNNGSTGQPKDCVSAITASALFEDDRCSDSEVAICECEP